MTKSVVADGITAEMVSIWRRLHEIASCGDDQFWEEEGGRKREFYNLELELHHRHFGLRPHQFDAFEARDERIPSFCTQDWQRADYRRAHALSKLLDRAAEKASRAARRPAQPRLPAVPARSRPTPSDEPEEV
jgi:hypothetical protein